MLFLCLCWLALFSFLSVGFCFHDPQIKQIELYITIWTASIDWWCTDALVKHRQRQPWLVECIWRKTSTMSNQEPVTCPPVLILRLSVTISQSSTFHLWVCCFRCCCCYAASSSAALFFPPFCVHHHLYRLVFVRLEALALCCFLLSKEFACYSRAEPVPIDRVVFERRRNPLAL